jgi:hypothetical protein
MQLYCNFCCDFLLLTNVNDWMSYECSDEGISLNCKVQNIITHLLVSMYQKKKITVEIAAKIASVIILSNACWMDNFPAFLWVISNSHR